MPPVSRVDQDHIDELCEELRSLLDAEIAAGNTVFETWKGNWPFERCLYIMLASPFILRHDQLASGLRFHSLNDPHHWKAEIICDRTNHVLACHYQ